MECLLCKSHKVVGVVWWSVCSVHCISFKEVGVVRWSVCSVSLKEVGVVRRGVYSVHAYLLKRLVLFGGLSVSYISERVWFCMVECLLCISLKEVGVVRWIVCFVYLLKRVV